jgi:hypothetical protein
MRFGDSANTPELPPNVKPGSENGLCQPRTISYGLGPTGPEMTPGMDCASSCGTVATSARSAATVARILIVTPSVVGHAEVRDAKVALDQIAIVLRIEDRALDVVSGEAFDGVEESQKDSVMISVSSPTSRCSR